jgi:hypothetical protein
MPQKQQENKEPLLVRLLQGATSLVNAVHADGGNDNDGLVLLVCRMISQTPSILSWRRSKRS